MTLREKIDCMQAFERGEEIEVAYRGYDIWSSMSTPSWNFEDRNYRIKPKPKQAVVIERWLCKRSGDDDCMYIREATKEDFWYSIIQVKLLDTYEVEL